MSDQQPLTDATGQVHQPVTNMVPRIVSLVPSITELLCDLGLAAHIVGRTGFCIHPAEVLATIPKVGGTKDVNIEKIRQLAPTHLIVNIDENEKPTVEQLAQFIPHVIVTHPLTPRDNLELYRLLGGIFQVEQQAQQRCDQLEDQFARLDTILAAHPPARQQMRVLYCIWKDPWMTVTADTYIAQMLALIGWTIWSPPDSSARYPQFAWDAEMLREIDLVLLSTEPYRFNDTHVDLLERSIGKPVQLIDGEMISWYGSRAIAGVAYLADYYQQ